MWLCEGLRSEVITVLSHNKISVFQNCYINRSARPDTPSPSFLPPTPCPRNKPPTTQVVPLRSPPSLPSSRTPRERTLSPSELWSTNSPVNPTTAPSCSSLSSYTAYTGESTLNPGLSFPNPTSLTLEPDVTSYDRHLTFCTTTPLLTSRRCRQSIPLCSQWPIVNCMPL